LGLWRYSHPPGTARRLTRVWRWAGSRSAAAFNYTLHGLKRSLLLWEPHLPKLGLCGLFGALYVTGLCENVKCVCALKSLTPPLLLNFKHPAPAEQRRGLSCDHFYILPESGPYYF
jgi:hypothetical protein